MAGSMPRSIERTLPSHIAAMKTPACGPPKAPSMPLTNAVPSLSGGRWPARSVSGESPTEAQRLSPAGPDACAVRGPYFLAHRYVLLAPSRRAADGTSLPANITPPVATLPLPWRTGCDSLSVRAGRRRRAD